jgi:hypothetical protein
VCARSAACARRREVFLQFQPERLPHPYTVLISTFEPGVERAFVLRVAASKPIKFERM